MAGGGVAGHGFHTGALHALWASTGWDPRSAEVVVGTSSGAIVAAILRSGISTAELRARVVATGPDSESDIPLKALTGLSAFRLPLLWRGPAAPRLVASEVRRGRRIRPSNLLLGGLPRGRVATTPLRVLIEQFHADGGWPTEPLWIPATDLRTGRRVVFGHEEHNADLHTNVAAAVEASCAIPGYFAPVQVDNRQMVDGGMRSPDNADLLLEAELDVVVISSPLSVDGHRYRRSPILGAMRAYPRRQLRANVSALRATGTEVLVLEPDHALSKEVGINAMSPAKLRPIVASSAQRIAEYLAEVASGQVQDRAEARALQRLVSGQATFSP